MCEYRPFLWWAVERNAGLGGGVEGRVNKSQIVEGPECELSHFLSLGHHLVALQKQLSINVWGHECHYQRKERHLLPWQREGKHRAGEQLAEPSPDRVFVTPCNGCLIEHFWQEEGERDSARAESSLMIYWSEPIRRAPVELDWVSLKLLFKVKTTGVKVCNAAFSAW